jgi:hypothetical protein
MTEHTATDVAKCPHCREDITDQGPSVRQTADEPVLTCPDCDSVLGGAVSNEVFVGLASLALADDLDEVAEVLDQLDVGVAADGDSRQALNHYSVTE